MQLIIDICGWLGAVLFLIAYALVSKQVIKGNSLPFQLLNLIGAMLFIINSGYHGAYPSAVLNLIWVFIGTITILSIYIKRNKHETK
ncbi:MAG: hypothetical protein L3J83_03150 [Proteobacteria bacterium]|nr:hypothetical protein [Pseudomonadota bacterium]